MLVDLTLEVTAEMVAAANSNLKRSFSGHLGTHFDIMDKRGLPLINFTKMVQKAKGC